MTKSDSFALAIERAKAAVQRSHSRYFQARRNIFLYVEDNTYADAEKELLM